MSQELGTFTPYQYSGNNKDNKGPRMAGDMLNDFSQGNVAKVLGANKDYRNGVSNEDTAYQPSVDNASNKNNNSKAPKVSASSPAPQASAAAPASQSGSGWSGQTEAGRKQRQAQAADRAAKQQQAQANLSNRTSELTASYDPDKYRYYESDFGTGTGHEAYAKDMAKYESAVATNNGNSLLGGHLGLVSEMMHPDWGRSQRAGGGAEDPTATEQDYSTRPQFEAGSKAGALFDRKFGGSSSIQKTK